jgi:hypothetical protein
MDADTCGDETSLHLEGPQSLVNSAHIGKIKRRRGAKSLQLACSASENKFIIS